MAHPASTARVIDVHAHAVLAETMGAAGTFGPEIGASTDGVPWFRVGSYRLDGVRYVGSPFMDPALRVQRMDAAGIDFQILSPNPLTLFHFIPAPQAIAFCTTHNDALARVVAAHPTRLAALAALPLQSIPDACAELRRAVNDLGFLGALIGTDAPHPLDSPAMDALYETCVALNVPLFIHPGPAGIDGPPGDPALKRFDLDVIVGFAAQEVLAVCTLIFGGVLDRHPALDICLSHGGGSAGYLFGRMSRAAKKRPWAPEALRADGAMEERFSRLWFDNHLNRDASLDLLVSIIGDDRLVYGTNFAGWDAPDAGMAHLPDAKLAHNARKLLRL
ncbi:MAG: amidohydrolase family protein [Gemmobacter sp.]|nr:amidohydrolase family protein [Gemmobacter sp.]